MPSTSSNTDQSITPPGYGRDAFCCPSCNAFAHQQWAQAGYSSGFGLTMIDDLEFSLCQRCQRLALWHKTKMVWPKTNTAPSPNGDLPVDVRADYSEAAQIAHESPRGAAALLRLAVQKLCAHVLQSDSKSTIDKDIGLLVSRGLPVTIQRALDTVRVIGNEAVHPGELDLRDDTATVNSLFLLINLIAESLITVPLRVTEIYSGLPESKLDGIRARDRKASPSDSASRSK